MKTSCASSSANPRSPVIRRASEKTIDWCSSTSCSNSGRQLNRSLMRLYSLIRKIPCRGMQTPTHFSARMFQHRETREGNALISVHDRLDFRSCSSRHQNLAGGSRGIHAPEWKLPINGTSQPAKKNSFAGLETDHAVWDGTVFTRSRERPIRGRMSRQHTGEEESACSGLRFQASG